MDEPKISEMVHLFTFFTPEEAILLHARRGERFFRVITKDMKRPRADVTIREFTDPTDAETYLNMMGRSMSPDWRSVSVSQNMVHVAKETN